MYWYVSKSKVQTLIQAGPWDRAKLRKLKLGPFEIEGEMGDWSALSAQAEKICSDIDERDEMTSPDRLCSGVRVPFFRFSGEAARCLDHSAFWVALEDRGVAVLLVGSQSHLAGTLRGTGGKPPSPSADPIGSAREAFDRPERYSGRLSGNLSYVWQHVFASGGGGAGVLPRVEGAALFAGLFETDPFQMERAGCARLSKLVLGSPIYIRQI